MVKWADLQEYTDFMREFVASAQASMKAGRTIDQAVAEMKLPARYSNYDMAQARNDVQRVLRGVEARTLGDVYPPEFSASPS